MTLNYKLYLYLGLITLLVPFLGIPQSWKDFILFTIGLILISIALYKRNHEKMEEKGDLKEVFVESDPVSDSSYERPKKSRRRATSKKQEDYSLDGQSNEENTLESDNDEYFGEEIVVLSSDR